MFIGHYAVAFAARKAAPKTSLATLIVASQFIDVLWPVFLLLGIEHASIEPGNTVVTPMNFYDYPLSHSLLTVPGWSLGFAVVVGGIVGTGCPGASRLARQPVWVTPAEHSGGRLCGTIGMADRLVGGVDRPASTGADSALSISSSGG